MIKKLIFIFFIMFFVFLSLTPMVFAQLQTDSNTINTRVGNPPVANDVVKIGMDIKSAYDACNSGDTHDTTGTLGSCLRTQLSGSGYSNSYLDAFEARRKNSITSHPDGTFCTECVGYVGLVLTLLSGSTNTLGVAYASDIASLPSLSAGTIVFQRLQDNTSLQPGDVGAKSGGAGHVLVVNEVIGNIKFTALESNANLDCHITSTKEWNKEGWVFFRKI